MMARTIPLKRALRHNASDLLVPTRSPRRCLSPGRSRLPPACLRRIAVGWCNLRDDSDYDDYRWAQIIRQKCHNMGIDMAAEDEYLVAERLMKFPVGLLAAYVFGDPR